jgi:hypothetical protein
MTTPPDLRTCYDLSIITAALLVGRFNETDGPNPAVCEELFENHFDYLKPLPYDEGVRRNKARASRNSTRSGAHFAARTEMVHLFRRLVRERKQYPAVTMPRTADENLLRELLNEWTQLF